MKLGRQFKECDALIFFFADVSRGFRGSTLIVDALESVAYPDYLLSHIELKPVHVVSVYAPDRSLDTFTYLRREAKKQRAVPLARDICFNLEEQSSTNDRGKNFCAEKSFNQVYVAIKELKFWRRLVWGDPMVQRFTEMALPAKASTLSQ